MSWLDTTLWAIERERYRLEYHRPERVWIIPVLLLQSVLVGLLVAVL
jgi:hypothetical protein